MIVLMKDMKMKSKVNDCIDERYEDEYKN